MTLNRVFWTIIGAIGASIVGLCLAMHCFKFSAIALFGSREMVNAASYTIVIVGLMGWVFLLYHGMRYFFVDCIAIIAIGLTIGILVSQPGPDMLVNDSLTVFFRGAVYVGGLAMIRAWWLARPKREPRYEFSF